jgi:hypothetical protein
MQIISAFIVSLNRLVYQQLCIYIYNLHSKLIITNKTFCCVSASKQWTHQQRASRVRRLEIIKLYSRVWHCAGADICWEGVASDVNEHSTLRAVSTMRWSRAFRSYEGRFFSAAARNKDDVKRNEDGRKTFTSFLFYRRVQTHAF